MPCDGDAPSAVSESSARSNASATESECGRRSGRADAGAVAAAGGGPAAEVVAGLAAEPAAGRAAEPAAGRAGADEDAEVAGVAAGAAGEGDCVAGADDFGDDFDDAGGVTGALGDGAAGCRAPRGGAGIGAGGGDSTIVGSRSARGTLGSAPPRPGVRGSEVAAGAAS